MYNTNIYSYVNGLYYGENGLTAEQEFIINMSTAVKIVAVTGFIFLLLFCYILIEYKTYIKTKKE